MEESAVGLTDASLQTKWPLLCNKLNNERVKYISRNFAVTNVKIQKKNFVNNKDRRCNNEVC
jgi:hypothetical protein